MQILAGMYAHQETGLYYWGARYYDPRTGRGISADGMSVAAHVRRWQANMGMPGQPPLELNPYVAVANNPLRWIDPDGFETKLNLFEGANGAGHLGLQMGNDPSKGKYPRDTDISTKLKNMLSIDVPGIIARDNPTHLIDSITFQTTPDEENRLRSCVNNFQNTSYDLYSDSCVAPPKKCLSEIGIKLDSSIIPKIIFRNLKQSLPQLP